MTAAATPIRLQLSRRGGFNLQEASRAANGLRAVRVTRPGPWGNPYQIYRDPVDRTWMVGSGSCHWGPYSSKDAATLKSVALFRADVEQQGPHNHRLIGAVPIRVDIIKGLRGHNLGCFCALDAPCHADVLLGIANGPLCEAVPA